MTVDDATDIRAAITANPRDAHARLLYADACGESGYCPKGEELPPEERELRLQLYRVTACPDDGLRHDLAVLWEAQGERDRAELVRVQCALDNTVENLTRAGVKNLKHMVSDETPLSRLILANADRWRRGPKCGQCDGEGEFTTSHRQDCYTCHGTGDDGGLMELQVPENSWDGIYRHPVTFHGGTMQVECSLADAWGERKEMCWECDGKKTRIALVAGSNFSGAKHAIVDCETCEGLGYTVTQGPTDWLLSVLRAHPVTSVLVRDREPSYALHQELGRFYWYSDLGMRPIGNYVPQFVFNRLMGSSGLEANPKSSYATYPTREAAITAMARAFALSGRDWLEGVR